MIRICTIGDEILGSALLGHEHFIPQGFDGQVKPGVAIGSLPMACHGMPRPSHGTPWLFAQFGCPIEQTFIKNYQKTIQNNTKSIQMAAFPCTTDPGVCLGM